MQDQHQNRIDEGDQNSQGNQEIHVRLSGFQGTPCTLPEGNGAVENGGQAEQAGDDFKQQFVFLADS